MSEIEDKERREHKLLLDRAIAAARLAPDYGTVRDRVEFAKRAKRAEKLANKRARRLAS